MVIDHVEQGEEKDQEDWNIDNFGWTAKGKGKGKDKGTGKKGEGGDGDGHAREDSKVTCYWCEEQGHRASEY